VHARPGRHILRTALLLRSASSDRPMLDGRPRQPKARRGTRPRPPRWT